MKLQLGVLHLNGRLASLGECDAILGELVERSFEISGQAADGPLLMLYRGNRITFEEETEIQPLRQGPYILTWDGRLDNREELADRVALSHPNTCPDTVIVLKAFEMFGERIFADLIGEFALTLWSRVDRSLLFARSSCGVRPLYYVLDKNQLLWCSNFAHLVRVSQVELNIRDEYVIQHLVTTPDAKHTPLTNVETIPPNRVVRFKNGRMQCGSELWNPIHTTPLRYRTDREYEEHCRAEVTNAVRVRLRSKGPVFAELSGGLDSSTIVLTADRILRTRNQSSHDLHTVSCVYEKSRSADERGFIRAVEGQRGIETHLVHEDDQRIGLYMNDPPFTGLPHTLHFFPGRYEAFSSLMQQNGARILLTGRGGDHLFWSVPDGTAIVADDLCRLNLIRAYRQCRVWSRVAAIPFYELLFNKAFRLMLGTLIPGRYLYENPELPTWVHPRHRTRMRDLRPDFDGCTTWHTLPSRRAQVFSVDRMFRMFGSGFGEEYPSIYTSHPYSHRPLVEFCVSAPISQFLRDGQTRSLMRRAMHDLLPGKTVSRISKGLVDETIIRALRREFAPVSDLANWQVCQRGYVLYPEMVEAIREARLGILNLLGPLIRLFSLERWLRSLSRAHLRNSADTDAHNFAPAV